MAIIDYGEARLTTRRLTQGKNLNEVTEYFLTVMTQKLQSSEYAAQGVQAAKRDARTVDISTPHGDVVCNVCHVRLDTDVAGRLTFTAIRTDVGGNVSGTEILTVVVAADWTVERISDTTAGGRFGPTVTGDSIIDEINVLMLSKLQASLPQVQ
ncbi:hypothetical protein [Burkholderia multivorans]|nr:hypothetical protein [Burkholderia multivorans]MDR9053037.1 hypothetical protein [Burkholderia multivorans]MDR9058698.1 hypothetical protein [Burkholderia multivorans]MDR9063085.1 hypothetical protein [Burkholderia multivorans]MDR9070692.1 hypothetical protein [Burkholderia multivorans]MDR9076971.1 hypothetical protein [Burkholderia multivorans]